ncbi:MAG: carboxypeptidase-like regulatory domain-containing protein [Flavobacterium sp.]|uniref:carboxypeptidase-like regulatory domain-containing protein n=1 Tax=Flavobacterium sp. TaxID=239 RepID=UPI003264B18D
MKNTVYFFLFITSTLSSQIKGIVVDDKGSPIQYVNIWVENEDIGTTSDENGIFKIYTTSDKVLIFSSVGYEVKKTAIKDNDKIILKEAIFKLKELVISNRKKDKEIEIGEAKKIHHSQLSGNKPWIYGKLFEYDSIYEITPFLKKIVFFSDNEKKDARLKIRIFEFNDSIPTSDLLHDDLIVTVKRGMRKNEIDVSEYNIRFPEKGIVIGLEWMIIEENKYFFEYESFETKEIVKSEAYAPSLIVNYSEVENSFNYMQGKWHRSKITPTVRKDKPWYNKVMLPAINLILTN